MLELRVTGSGARVGNERGQLVAPDAHSGIRSKGGGQRLRNRRRVAELVDLDHVRDVAALGAKPNDAACEDWRRGKKTARCYSPVPFVENEIRVSFIAFATLFDVRAAAHLEPPNE